MFFFFSQSDAGTLKLSGYIRGQTLSVNGLVHLPGWGDFQMLQIDAPHDPYKVPMHSGGSVASRSRHNSEMVGDIVRLVALHCTTLCEADFKMQGKKGR